MTQSETVCFSIMNMRDREVNVLLGVPRNSTKGVPYESGDIIQNRRHVTEPYEYAVILGVGETLDDAKRAGQQYYDLVAEAHRKEEATQFF